ncbi:MAG: HTTM domain-containing protein [Acidimicrobiia bacterium]
MLNRLVEEINPRPLGLTRVMIGAAALLRGLMAWPLLHTLAADEVLRFPYFDWLPRPNPGLALVIVCVWVAAALALIVGWHVSVAAPVLAVTIVFTLSLDMQLYGNHLYLMAWLVLLLAIADSGAGLTFRRADRAIVRWPTMLLMIQLSVVYGFSGLTKLNETFISGTILNSVLQGGLVSFPQSLKTPGFLTFLALSAIFVELFIAVFIWSGRFRPAVFFLGFGLHFSILLFMGPTNELFVFAIEMLAVYPLFLYPERLVVLWDDTCGSCRGWIRRFQRFDVLGVLQPEPADGNTREIEVDQIRRSLHLLHHGETTTGFAAVGRIMEHLVPTLWVAGVMRLPGVRWFGERWYRWQAARRSCLAGERH